MGAQKTLDTENVFPNADFMMPSEEHCFAQTLQSRQVPL